MVSVVKKSPVCLTWYFEGSTIVHRVNVKAEQRR